MKTKPNITILYVEDETNIREQLSRFIIRFCTKLLTAENGEIALELYKTNKVDIVISDIRMPVMNGITMAKKMKEINPQQLLIFISAHSESSYLFNALNMQADGYILKPVDLSILETKLLKLIDIHNNKLATQKLKESEEKFRKIAENSEIGIFIYQEHYIYVNNAFCRLTGYTQEELYAMQPWELLEKNIQEEFKKIAHRRLLGEEFHKEYNDIKVITKSHEKKIFRVSASTLKVEEKFAGMGMVVDVSDFIKTQEKLTLLAQAIEQMDEMVKITSISGEIVYVNNAILKHTLYNYDEILGHNNNIFKSGKHDNSFYKKLWDTILDKHVFHSTLINKKKDNTLYYEDQTITPIVDEKTDQIKYFVSTSKDISKEISMLDELKNLATKDALTQIYNRYRINQIIEDELIRAKRYNESFALLMFDIDHFKHVNDTYGHDVGDMVLKDLAKIISSNIRESDRFGRWGGEEFMLLATKIDKEHALTLAQKLRKSVEEHPFKKVGKITISIGVVMFNKNKTVTQLLKEVDDALYEAKHQGRNTVVIK